MSIALDVMGGDLGPQEIIAGALLAAPQLRCPLLLVGPPDQIKPHLTASAPKNITIKPASQWVEMHEKPLDAYKRKKDSSIMVGCKLVKEGEAQAFVSAGNTGAVSATALLVWRQLAGLHRPAIATPMPNKQGGFVLLDAGASPDVDPEHLVEFALMGRAYAQQIMGRKNPTVHLLNIGEEEGKGNAFAKECYKLLKQHSWFSGNIEGKDAYLKPCDVVVCDAFVGNVFLKTSEGLAELIMQIIKDGMRREPWLKWMYLPMKPLFAPIKKQMDYAETGGSPLLGLNGLCLISHGRSNARAIENALLMAQRCLENRLVDTIRESVVVEMGQVP